MIEFEERLKLAKFDKIEMKGLLIEYTPFVKKCIADSNIYVLEFDDMLSIAMITFVNCVKQYDKTKRSFMGFARVCIKNRLINESRKQTRYFSNVVSLHSLDDVVLVAGCAHNGIINIMNKAEIILDKDLTHVISGFHLFNPITKKREVELMITEIGEMLNKKSANFYTCHCTGKKAYDVLSNAMGTKIDYISTGTVFDI